MSSRQRIREKMRRGLAAGTSVAVAAACCIQAAAPASATSAAHTRVTLSWEMWVGGAASIKYWEHDASLVHKYYPWITVKLTNQPSYSDYWVKLPVEISSKTETDLVATQNLRTSSFRAGFLPLTASQLTSDGIPRFSLTDYYRAAVGGYYISAGKLIALPYDVGPLLMFYNATVFHKYHLPLPSDSWTWATFYKDIAKIQKDSGGAIYGYADDPFFDEFLTYATDMGANYLTRSGKLDIANARFASLLKQYVAPVKKGLAPLPPANASVTGVWDLQQWQAGAAATYIDGPWDLISDISAVKEGIENFKIGVAPLPHGPSGKSSTLLSGSGFGISADLYKNHPGMNKTELLSDAVKAIEIMTGPTFENINAADGDFPSRPSSEKYFFKTATKLGVPEAAAAIKYALKDAVPYRATNRWNGTEDAFNSQIVGVMQGSITPQAALRYTQNNQGAPVS